MADTIPVVASAVIVPEAEDLPPPLLKRRQSSISDAGSKRRRLSHGQNVDSEDVTSPKEQAKEASRPGRPGGNQAEERKRGRRLFGALLGTLSQSSSSTAQKRRTEIERKQQEKLRQQAEEQDEANKEKLEALMAQRRQEQKIYVKQAMNTRHSNLLAQARFLQTKSEPKLFYKPWELLPGDEQKIKDQVMEAEAIVDREVAQWQAENESSRPSEDKTLPETHQEEKAVNGRMDTVGDESSMQEPSGPDIINSTNNDDQTFSTDEPVKPEHHENAKDHGDGEEVLEGEEDTVIY